MNNCTKKWVQFVEEEDITQWARNFSASGNFLFLKSVPAKLFVPLLYPGYLSVVKGSEFSKTMALNFSIGRVFRLVLSPKRCLGFNTSAFRRKAAWKNINLTGKIQSIFSRFLTCETANKVTKRANLIMIFPSKLCSKWPRRYNW